MKPLEVNHQAFAFGLRLEPSGDKLLVFGDHCPQEFAEVLREHKGELIHWLICSFPHRLSRTNRATVLR